MSEPAVPTDSRLPAAARPPGPRVTLVILRVAVALSTLMILAQPILAGAYLQGEFDALGLHRNNALLIFPVLLVQIGAALVYWLAGRGRALPLIVATGMFFAAVLQLGMGFARLLAVHIPLGVGIVTLAVLQAIWVFSWRASAGRTWRSARAAGTTPTPNLAVYDETAKDAAGGPAGPGS